MFPLTMAAMGRVLSRDGKKHQKGLKDDAWRKRPIGHHMHKMAKHINAFEDTLTSKLDRDSGESHLVHAAVRLLMRIELEL